MYLQELHYNIGAENDPEMLSQAMSSKESNSWYNVMKEEMNYMASNRVWDLVELPDGIKAIGCNGSLKRRTHWATSRDIRLDSLPKDSIKGKESTTQRPFLLYLRKILFR